MSVCDLCSGIRPGHPGAGGAQADDRTATPLRGSERQTPRRSGHPSDSPLGRRRIAWLTGGRLLAGTPVPPRRHGPSPHLAPLSAAGELNGFAENSHDEDHRPDVRRAPSHTCGIVVPVIGFGASVARMEPAAARGGGEDGSSECARGRARYRTRQARAAPSPCRNSIPLNSQVTVDLVPVRSLGQVSPRRPPAGSP